MSALIVSASPALWAPSRAPGQRSAVQARRQARSSRRSRGAVTPAAFLQTLLQPLRQRGGGGGSGAAAAAAQRRLLAQLAAERPDEAAISAAVDELMAAGVPFREGDLGPGAWTVVYTRGPLLWQARLAAARSGRVTDPRGNQASQDFDPRGRRVVNRGQLLGASLALTAEGSYEPVEGAAGRKGCCPQRVRATIERGSLVAWRATLALPISGAGLVDVAYLDGAAGLRIFKSLNGSVSVQMRRPPQRAAAAAGRGQQAGMRR